MGALGGQGEQRTFINNGKFQPLQIGSYFGAALCSVDLDGDANTDLVLIGAPMYYDSVTGGRVYVCERQVRDGEGWARLTFPLSSPMKWSRTTV